MLDSALFDIVLTQDIPFFNHSYYNWTHLCVPFFLLYSVGTVASVEELSLISVVTEFKCISCTSIHRHCIKTCVPQLSIIMAHFSAMFHNFQLSRSSAAVFISLTNRNYTCTWYVLGTSRIYWVTTTTVLRC